MVTNSRPQFEKPMSKPEAIPVGATFFSDFFQSICARDLPVKHLYKQRIIADMTSLKNK